MVGWAVPGLAPSAPVIVAGFVLLLFLSIVKPLADSAKTRGSGPKEANMKQKARTLLVFPTLSTLYSVGTGSLSGALSSRGHDIAFS